MPQVWAWASWRMRRLQQLSDGVMCLLPFEADLCRAAGIPAWFVGHPLFEELQTPLAPLVDGVFPVGQPRLAMLPGSRRKELARNLPCFVAASALLREEFPALAVALCLRRVEDVARCEAALGGALPAWLHPVCGMTQHGLTWADAALVKSGTSTLEALGRDCPHVMAFCASPTLWRLAGQHVVTTRTFALPNLLAQALGRCAGPVAIGRGRVVPEFCPHFGDPQPLASALGALLRDPLARARQRDDFMAIRAAFTGVDFASACAELVLGAAAARTT
jgi:lipid-A-disaccharide synthase